MFTTTVKTGVNIVSLACRKFNSHNDRPWLVWLHGLLGCSDEWLPLVNLCAQHPSLVIDLPGHGDSTDVQVKDLMDMSCLLSETLAEQQISKYWLMGYSLGGRIAMYHASYGDIRGLCGLLIEGGNPGLFSQQERNNRLEHDRNWAGVFVLSRLNRFYLIGISSRFFLIYYLNSVSDWSKYAVIIMAMVWLICWKIPHLDINLG